MSEWVKTKNWLPIEDKEVLVKHRSREGLFIALYHSLSERWYFSTDRVGHVNKEMVTHWMELPELPEEEE